MPTATAIPLAIIWPSFFRKLMSPPIVKSANPPVLELRPLWMPDNDFLIDRFCLGLQSGEQKPGLAVITGFHGFRPADAVYGESRIIKNVDCPLQAFGSLVRSHVHGQVEIAF